MRRHSLKLNIWLLIVFVFAAGTAGTLWVYQSVLKWQEKIIQADFRSVAGDRVSLLQTMINTDMTALWALQSFFASTPDVSREEFAAFTEQLLRLHPHVHSYHWIPRVTGGERAAFESQARKSLGSFQITEMNSDGHLVPARQAAEYFPTFYIEPFKKNHFGLGFNQFSVAERKRCMLKAARAKTILATRVHPLWRFLPQEKSEYFFVFLPVYEKGQPSVTLEQRKAHLKGYAAAAFDIKQLIQGVYTTTNMSELDLEFYAETVDAKSARIEEYRASNYSGAKTPKRLFSYREILSIADQRWLVIANSTEFFRTSATHVEVRGILLTGFLVTLLFCLFLILWEQRKRQDFFLRLSIKDDLTKLYNRRGLLALGNEHLKLVRRKHMESMMLFADLDGLKKINDTYGHGEGDKAIMAAAKILKGTFRESDIVARTGGDEFVVFAFDIGMRDEATVVKHLQENMERYNSVRPHPYKVMLSVGCIAVDPESGDTLEKILEDADKEMYLHKLARRLTAG
jgi:diguanylate cyclase (GGDEF)-like protein